MAGYIKLYRKFADWEWYQDANVVRVFLHLLLTANYEDKRWQGKSVGKGQVIVGRKRLAEALNLTERNIRTALEKLESTGEIKREVTSKYTLITICNYVSYQSTEECERPTNDQQMTNKRPTNDQQTTTTKEYKEYKEREEDNPPTYAHVYARDGDVQFFAAMKRGGTQWQEDACRTLKITLPELADLVCQFEVECRAKGTTHISWKDASSHFIDWGRRQVRSRQKTNYGSRNKENIDKRGGFEPADNTDYSA